ncbi:MAG: Ig-like domain-containing protein [bacterium]|nr:Ig-like domain-containing protein [bacterium]
MSNAFITQLASRAGRRARTTARRGLSLTLAATTIIWALGIPLGVLIPQPANAAALTVATVMPSTPATAATGVTYTVKLTTPSGASSNIRSVGVNFLDAVPTFPGVGNYTTCSLTVGGTAVPGVGCLNTGSLAYVALTADDNAPTVTIAASTPMVWTFGPVTNPAGAGPATATVFTDDTGNSQNIGGSIIDEKALTLRYGTAPTLTGGGPGNGQSFVPLEATIDINIASGSLLTSGDASPSTATVTVNKCTGATDALTCASPETNVNRCSTVTVGNGLGTNDRITCAASLETSTTYKLTVDGTVQGSTNIPLGASVSRIFRTGSVDSGTNTTSPRVLTTVPGPGTQSVPLNTAIAFVFPTGPEGDMLANGTANAVDNVDNIRLRPTTNGVLGTDVCTTANSCTGTWDGASRTLRVNGVTLIASTTYDFCLAANVLNAQSRSMTADACYSFTTGTTSDTTAPTLATADPLKPANGATGVDPAVTGSLRISFSENIRPDTVTTTTFGLCNDTDGNGDSNCDTLEKIATTAYNVSTDPSGRDLNVSLNAALTASKRYCYFIGTGIRDLAGNAIAADITNKCFTTGSATAVSAPTLQYCDADSFGFVCGFDQPMAVSGLISSNNVNTSNVALQCPTGVPISLASKAATWDAEFRELRVMGVGLQPGQDCRVTVTNAAGFTGTAISTTNSANVANFTVLDATTTGGTLGFSGSADTNFYSDTDFGSYWVNPQRCEPRVRITGKNTILECEFPAPASLPASSTFTLTFPSGFTYTDSSSNAIRAVPAATSFVNADINGPAAAGAPTIASVTCNTVANTCTVTTGTATIASGDRIFFELDRLQTPTTAVTDKKISVIVKDNSGIKKGETINPSPFSIQSAGAYAISGTACKSSVGGGTCNIPGGDTAIASAKVFCQQQGGYLEGSTAGVFAGSQETTTDANGDWTVSGLSNGQYGCGMPPDPTTTADVGSGESFKQLTINGASSSDVDFKFENLAVTGQTLSVTIASGATLNGEVVDLFCHAGTFDSEFSRPVMKTVTLDSAGAGTTTLKLKGGKTYECGIGPHIDFSNFTSGPPPVPDFAFMPPPPTRVVVPTSSDPSAITFTLDVASNTISGTVQDGSATGIANVYVNAFPLGCFDSNGAFKQCNGGFAQSKSDGTFTLNVSGGTYEVRAFSPGMPESEPQILTVTTASLTGVIIKLQKSATTIAGQVLDESGNEIQYAGVDAERITAGGSCSSFTPNGGHSFSPTNSSGNYTLYVSNGTWNVRAHAPSYGQVGCTTVVVSGTSLTGKNLQATAGDFKTVSGTCPSGAFIGAFGTNGGNHGACSEGAYSIKVPAGTGYTVECFANGKGHCGRSTSVDTSSANQTVNFGTSVTTGTLQITITGITDAFVDVRDSSGLGNGTGQNSAGVYTLTIPPGTYTVRGGSPKYGDLCSDQSAIVTANTTTAITCTPPANLRTVAGRVTDGSTNLAGASITVTSTTSGKMFNTRTGSQTSTNSNLSLTNVPDGSYTIRASKSGYGSASANAIVSGGNLTLSENIALTQATGSAGDTVIVSVRDDSDVDYNGNARVTATNASGNVIVAEMDKTTSDASLSLTNGTWTVTTIGDNGKKTTSSTTVTVTNGTASTAAFNADLDTAVSGFTPVSNNVNFTPTAGGLMKSEDIIGLSINAPMNAFSTTDSSTATMQISKDPTVAGIDPGGTSNFVGSSGFTISPTDANGKELSDLSSNVTITIPFSASDLSAASVSDEGTLLLAAIDANGEWETFSTTVDEVNNLLTAEISHFSTFGIVGSTSGGGSPTSSDVQAPGAVMNVTSSASANSVTLSWTDPADTDLAEIEILRNTPPSTAVAATAIARVAKGVKTFVDTALTSATKYFYILRSKDTSGNTRNSDTISITTAATSTAAPTTGTTTPAPTTDGGGSGTAATTTAPSATPGATSIGLNAGDIVKATSSNAVYLVGANGKRYVYPNELTFKSWHKDFSKVKHISNADMATLQLGGFVTVRPGTWLVKIESDPKVYAVEPGSALRWVETEQRAQTLYGTSWNKKIVDVPVSFWVGYTQGNPLGADVHPTGTIVSSAGARYYIDGGVKRLVTNDVFSALGYQDHFVHALDATVVYGDGSALTSTATVTFARE